MFVAFSGLKKLGQPEPLSNLWAESNNIPLQQTHLKYAGLSGKVSFEKAISVAPLRVTSKAISDNSSFHSVSVLYILLI